MQDTITGFLLAGVGNVDVRKKTNFLLVDSSELRARGLRQHELMEWTGSGLSSQIDGVHPPAPTCRNHHAPD